MLSHGRCGFNDTGLRHHCFTGVDIAGVRRRTWRPTAEHSSWRELSLILISLNKRTVSFVRHGTKLDHDGVSFPVLGSTFRVRVLRSGSEFTVPSSRFGCAEPGTSHFEPRTRTLNTNSEPGTWNWDLVMGLQ